MRRRLLLAAAASLLATACSDVAPRVTPEFAAAARARDPGLDDAVLARGRQAFVMNCASCHALPDPLATPAGEWPEMMRSMGAKAHLDAAASRDALRYVLAVRAQAR